MYVYIDVSVTVSAGDAVSTCGGAVASAAAAAEAASAYHDDRYCASDVAGAPAGRGTAAVDRWGSMSCGAECSRRGTTSSGYAKITLLNKKHENKSYSDHMHHT